MRCHPVNVEAELRFGNKKRPEKGIRFSFRGKLLVPLKARRYILYIYLCKPKQKALQRQTQSTHPLGSSMHQC